MDKSPIEDVLYVVDGWYHEYRNRNYGDAKDWLRHLEDAYERYYNRDPEEEEEYRVLSSADRRLFEMPHEQQCHIHLQLVVKGGDQWSLSTPLTSSVWHEDYAIQVHRDLELIPKPKNNCAIIRLEDRKKNKPTGPFYLWDVNQWIEYGKKSTRWDDERLSWTGPVESRNIPWICVPEGGTEPIQEAPAIEVGDQPKSLPKGFKAYKLNWSVDRPISYNDGGTHDGMFHCGFMYTDDYRIEAHVGSKSLEDVSTHRALSTNPYMSSEPSPAKWIVFKKL